MTLRLDFDDLIAAPLTIDRCHCTLSFTSTFPTTLLVFSLGLLSPIVGGFLLPFPLARTLVTFHQHPTHHLHLTVWKIVLGSFSDERFLQAHLWVSRNQALRFLQEDLWVVFVFVHGLFCPGWCSNFYSIILLGQIYLLLVEIRKPWLALFTRDDVLP